MATYDSVGMGAKSEMQEGFETDVFPQDPEIQALIMASPTAKVAERRNNVWHLHVNGVPATQIAIALKISTEMVRADLREIGKRCRDELLNQDPVDLVAETLYFLQEMERIALMEVNQATGTITKEIDKKTGAVIETRSPDPNKAKFFSAVLKAREMQLDLLMSTGLIPKNRSDLFEKIGKKEEAAEVREERSEEEIRASIEDLAKYGRFMVSKADKFIKESV